MYRYKMHNSAASVKALIDVYPSENAYMSINFYYIIKSRLIHKFKSATVILNELRKKFTRTDFYPWYAGSGNRGRHHSDSSWIRRLKEE